MKLTDFNKLPYEQRLSIARGKFESLKNVHIKAESSGLKITWFQPFSVVDSTTITVHEIVGHSFLYVRDVSAGVVNNFRSTYFGFVAENPLAYGQIERVIQRVKFAVDLYFWWIELDEDIQTVLKDEYTATGDTFPVTLPVNGQYMPETAFLRPLVAKLEPMITMFQRGKLLIWMAIVAALGLFIPWVAILDTGKFPVNVLAFACICLLMWAFAWGVFAQLTGWIVAYRCSVAPWKFIDLLPEPRYNDSRAFGTDYSSYE